MAGGTATASQPERMRLASMPDTGKGPVWLVAQRMVSHLGRSLESRSLWDDRFVVLAWETAGLRGTPAVALWKVGCAGRLEASTFTCDYKALENCGRSMRASSIGSASNQAGYLAALIKRQMCAACL